MAVTPAVPKPKQRRKVGSLNRPGIGQKAKRTQPEATQTSASCPDCGPNIPLGDDEHGNKICTECFSVVISASNIVAEVEFQEDSRGAAQVQGGYVGEEARHAKGSAAQRRMGGGEKDSRSTIDHNGRRAFGALGAKLGIEQSILDQALAIYKLAYSIDFFKGRRSEEVVAVCLYAACRRAKDNAVLFVDLAELQRVNVFRLGEVYKHLCRELYLKEAGPGTQHLIEIEALVMRYCGRLEFGDQTRYVVADTLKIIRRMKRDWIVPGRHPGGLCGAAIILAAHMNNFRRSVREVVYVAKVADATIMKRVEEFRRTKAAALTVDQFRQYGVRLKDQHDPPILYESQLSKDKFEARKRKRQEANANRDIIEISDEGSNASSRESSIATPPPTTRSTSKEGSSRKRRRPSAEQPTTPAPTQELRRDADGFAIPPIPTPLTERPGKEQSTKRGPGRPKKVAPEPIIITEEELIVEAELEKDINEALEHQDIVDSRNEVEKAKDEERAKALAEQKKKDDEEQIRLNRETDGITWLDDRLSAQEEITADDLEAAFANDPEVQNCLLNDAEQKIKERIWITHNEDWLRAQHERALKAIEDAAKPKKERKKTKKQSTMGDGTTLAEATTPIETPADATAVMLDKRGAGQSKFINYEMLRQVYGPASPSVSTSRQSETPSVSGAGGGESPPAAGGADRQASMSESPTPAPRRRAVRLQSPPATQTATAPVVPTLSSSQPEEANAPLSPPQTQTQAGAEQDEFDDPNDYVQDDNDEDEEYDFRQASPLRWRGDDEDEDGREDVGEDDYRRAIDPTGDIAMDDEYF